MKNKAEITFRRASKTMGVMLSLFFLGQSAHCQNRSVTISDFESLVGTWTSHLDTKYKDHPMIKKFNPNLNGQLTVFRWGIEKRLIHVAIYNLDRPDKGDTTLIIEGVIVPNPAKKTVRMIEYNGESNIYFEGDYEIDPHGNILRLYQASFENGGTAKFRERWIWKDDNKQSFEWHTDSYRDDTYKPGEIILELRRIQSQ